MHPIHLTAVTLVAALAGRTIMCGLIFCMGIGLILILVALDHFLSPPHQ